ncbi:type II toxin-antitoxin system toxin DNA ADP-ribosyl transferase DarT [Maribacter stanieri]|uniref:type II toxin-antitoxin system toxin DNA ADP-ribosyl transferase DarT n=1 Tax=Maribacter stanieri TaxID=440514 RepID=UPI0024943B8B|nr:DUF4433 domain-containing protein [Maribacter stanieri]
MDLTKAYIFRMTHIENIPHIIENGITHKDSDNSNKNYKPIGDSSLIGTRDHFLMPNGHLLGEYIPFYFGLRSPMLYVIQKGYNGVKAIHPREIIYCISSVQKIIDENLDFIYTDGHATDGFTNYFSQKEISNIENQVDFKATNAKFWKDENDLDLKRRKEAEFLIKQDLVYNNILGFATFEDNSTDRLLELGINNNKVVTKPTLYF